jgi:hypothetical protein
MEAAMAASLILPLVVLGALAAYVAGLGAVAWWQTQGGAAAPAAPAYLASAGLHLAWIQCAASRRAPLVAWVGFLVSLSLCRRGLASLPGGSASWAGPALLEGLVLLIALAVRSPVSLAERLARWRRARADIALQLRLGDGLLPWARDCGRRLIAGRADSPLVPTFQRLTAELAEIDGRLGLAVSNLAAPEQLRQFVKAGASQLLAEAEQAGAALAVELERRALALAAACREQCESIPSLPAEERTHAARQCEAFVLNLLPLAGSITRSKEP